MKVRITIVTILMGAIVMAALYWFLWKPFSGTSTQPSSQETQLVYDAWVHSGQRYNNVFYPQSEDTIYMISGVDNVIAPKLTDVYYWPLTSEYKADWAALDENLLGAIEIKQGKDTIALLERTAYSLIYSNIMPVDVMFGDQADESYQQYQVESKRLAQGIDDYYEAMIAYQIEYENYIEEIKKGNLDTVRPEPPPEEQPTLEQYVLKPSPGYHLNLPEGEYEIQLLTEDGLVVEGSQKNLRVFSPRQEGVGYKAFIPERWTKPETGADPEDTFNLQPDKTLFMQPYHTQEYNRFDYSKLLSPQQRAVGESAWFWVLTNEVDDVELQVSLQDKLIKTVNLDQYIVQQITGSKLGYDIVPIVGNTAGDRDPTFSAFRVTPPNKGAIYQIQMVDSEGEILDGSDRELRIITQTNASILYFIAAIPIILGAVAFGWRRYRTGRKDQP